MMESNDEVLCRTGRLAEERHRFPLVSKGGGSLEQQPRRFPPRAGSYVPAGTMAMVRLSDALRCLRVPTRFRH